MHRHRAAFHPGRLLHRSVIAELLLQLLEQITPKLRMGDGPPPEEDTQLHLIAGIKKLRRLAPLGLKVVPANLRLDTNFLQARHMLRLARITLFPALFVSEFAVIHQPADGGNRVWRNLYQVQSTLACHLQRIARVNHADLLPLIINKSYLADANSFVHTSLNWSRNSLPPELLALHVGHTKKPVQKTDVSPATTPIKYTTRGPPIQSFPRLAAARSLNREESPNTDRVSSSSRCNCATNASTPGKSASGRRCVTNDVVSILP